MPLLTTVWAVDEDVLKRCNTDYPLLVPPVQRSTQGGDGAFLSTDLWTLTSPSVNFLGYGVSGGQICYLAGPKPQFKPPGECWIISGVGTGTATIRRPSFAASIGAPPSPSGGLTGVSFTTLTVYPQIENASYNLNKIFGIDPAIGGRKPTDLIDPRQLCEVTVFLTLADLYLQASKQPDDDFWKKGLQYRSDATAGLDRLSLLWSPTLNPTGPTTRFNTRLSR